MASRASGPPLTPESPLAAGVTELASAVTTTMIAVLTLVAALVVVVGLARAILERRRNHLVIADVSALTSRVTADEIDVAGLSPLLRQGVLRWLAEDRRNVEWIVKGLLGNDAQLGRTPMNTTLEEATQTVTAAVNDSLDTLSKGLQAIAPDQAAGVVAAIGSLLPTPRGCLVRAYPMTRGATGNVRLGLSVELSKLDGTPIAATAFWHPPAAQGGAARLYQDEMIALLEVSARWIAVRRVALRLNATPARRRWSLSSAGHRRQQRGMQRLLAGGLALVAMKESRQHALAFGQGAVDDLRQAAHDLGAYHRPRATLGGVHEQLGFAYRRDSDEREARLQFLQAAESWTEAHRLLREHPGHGPDGGRPADLGDELELLRIRWLKCLLLSEDSRRHDEARIELTRQPPDSQAPRTLFSAACLYARAGVVLDSGYLRSAWEMLGRALLATHDDLIWQEAVDDAELAPLADRQRFVDHLRPYRLAGADRPEPDVLIAAAISEMS